MSIDGLTDCVSVNYLYLMLMQLCGALWMMVEDLSLLLYTCVVGNPYSKHYMVIDWASFQYRK